MASYKSVGIFCEEFREVYQMARMASPSIPLSTVLQQPDLTDQTIQPGLEVKLPQHSFWGDNNKNNIIHHHFLHLWLDNASFFIM